MSNYPEIIKAAFPAHKANQILQREQQQRGIVATPAKVAPPNPVQTTTKQSPKAPAAPQPATRVIVHHHNYQQPDHNLIRKAGHAAVLLALGFLGV